MYESCIFASVLRSADRSAATPHAKRRNAKYSIPSHQDIALDDFLSLLDVSFILHQPIDIVDFLHIVVDGAPI